MEASNLYHIDRQNGKDETISDNGINVTIAGTRLTVLKQFNAA